ncbi:hypothetical protein ACNKCJ_004347 [Cronobacter dublinensis]|uniref:hypothetical protein n=1 Tax=Cronobacter dublinensis TaxID=413497 RepID=UPI0024AE9969|nr:hypothetical protein [Cronobacter dublinensis]EKM6459752.1 hypothetical protein [Cronobacter dublinensis]EKY3205135.1 hypothetical protein [Cronobacter dublinensis]ELQ6160530.1 hypothetical protein [Cronobacter dublinensis]MDI7501513.1 hypothetical protein [Cronobacter dublinensis]MDI7503416.1 hypothetical protein [Cronobacter dublinensis]
MNTLSYIMPKLAWIIPLFILMFVAYVFIKNRESDKLDDYIKENGVDVEATMTVIKPDAAQRINNKIVAVITVQYEFKGKSITSKRGLSFYITDKDEFEVGKKIRIRINPVNPTQFYYPDYRTY